MKVLFQKLIVIKKLEEIAFLIDENEGYVNFISYILRQVDICVIFKEFNIIYYSWVHLFVKNGDWDVLVPLDIPFLP